MGERCTAPVFIVGCPRSGTTLLYHMLLSAGGFVYYRAESHVFDVIVPRFGNLASREAKERLMERWLASHFFARTELEPEPLRAMVMAECRNGGDFLRIVMGAMAERQGVPRWADCTPAHVLHMSQIKETIPEALFIHIIRDGRDVAMSLCREGWVSPFPWDRGRELEVAALQWEWIVSRGRREGQKLGEDYLEISFENLVRSPRQTLPEVGSFIESELDYDRILRVGIGSVSKPNTSFGIEGEAFNPVGRWREKLDMERLAALESLIGGLLGELGYETGANRLELDRRPRRRLMRMGYHSYRSLKHWAKTRTPLSRYLTDVGLLSQ